MSLKLAIGLGGMLLALLFLVGGLLAFGRVVRRLQLEFRKLKDDVEKIDLRYEQLEKKLKEVFQTIDLRITQLNQMAADIKVMKEETTALIKRAETPFFLFSDRWTTADTEFLVSVQNSGMSSRPINKWVVRSWIDGRTLIIWAPTAEIAARNVQVRYTASGGFNVGMAVSSPLGLAPAWDTEATA